MRTFEKTHPWLKFSVDLSRAPWNLWAVLGECQSKCEHIAKAPILPEVQKELLQVYLAKGSLATTAIEGNTLSEEEVLKHLRGELHLPPSREYLGREIDNIVEGCNFILGLVKRGVTTPPLNVQEIREFNKLVLRGLNLENDVFPGRIRKFSVDVPGYRGAPAKDCQYLLDRLCEWLNGLEFAEFPEMAIAFAIIKAILAHLYLAWIHPFGDGNGRTARLLEFRILISSGVPHPAAHLLSNHYNQTRSQYYHQLRRASQSGGEVIPFLMYAVQGFLDELKAQLDVIHAQQWNVVWRDFVYRSFKGRTGPSVERRRRLVFALTDRDMPVPVSKIPELTPRLARDYAQKTRKTISRDVSALIELGLVEKEGNAVRPRIEAIQGFRSVTASRPED